MGNRVTLKHGGAYEITLSKSGERAVIVEVFDMEEDASSVAPMTPPEWDAFVAAGNAALGRPAPASTPLATRIASEQGPPVDLSGICSEGREEEVYGLGYAKGRADAAAMAREAGPTVPRAAVAAVVPLLAGVSTMLADSDDAEAKREAVRRLDRIIVALGRMVTDGPTPTEAR